MHLLTLALYNALLSLVCTGGWSVADFAMKAKQSHGASACAWIRAILWYGATLFGGLALLFTVWEMLLAG